MSIFTPYIESTIVEAENLFYNGGLHLWQRLTSSTITVNSTSLSLVYSADRIGTAANGASTKNFSIARSIDVPTFAQAKAIFPFSYKLTCITGNTLATDDIFFPFLYRMEGYDYAKIHGKCITLGFWVKTNKPGIYACAFNAISYTRSYVTSFTVNSANVWEFKHITITLESTGLYIFDNGLGLEVSIANVGGTDALSPTSNAWKTSVSLNGYYDATSSNLFDTTNNYMNITGLTINQGPTPGQFTLSGKNIGGEIVNCQRYYEKSYDLETVPGSSTFNGATNAKALSSGGGSRLTSSPFSVRKRSASSSVVVYNPSSGISNQVYETISAATKALGTSQIGEHGFTPSDGLSNTLTDNATYDYQWSADNEFY